MKNISLFQGILLGIFGAGALLGVFVFATYTSDGGNSAVGTVVIWGTLPKEGVNAALVAATQVDQSLKAVSYIEHNQATIESELSTAIATGAAPDLVLISQEDLLSLAKLLTPIPPSTLSSRDFYDAFVSEGGLFASERGFYGVPFLIDPLVLFTNRTILASSGIARAPSTWEALTGLVPKVAVLTPSQQVSRSLIPLGTYSNIRNARGILSALFLQTGVPISEVSASGVRSSSLGQVSSGGTPPGQAVVRFYTQFADPSKVSYTWNNSLGDSQQVFANGDSALYIGYASEARFLRAANPNLDFDISPLPQPATATAKSTYGLMYAFAIPRGAKNSSGAYEAAAVLSGAAEQQAASNATGLAPASRGALAIIPEDPILAVAYASALYAAGWLSPAAVETDQVFGAMIGNVITGRSSIDVALATAARTLTSLLQQP